MDKKLFQYAIKYRIYPTDEQKTLFCKTFGCTRYIWNQMLAEFNETGLVPSPAKFKDERRAWLKEVDSLALTSVWKQLCQAIKNHRKNPKHFGKPAFKSKKNANRSYHTNRLKCDNVRFSEDRKHIRLPKLGDVRLKVHRMPQKDSVIQSVTVSQAPSGKFYVSVQFICESQTEEKKDMARSVGLDFSTQHLYVTSDGTVPESSRFYRKLERKLKREQRHLSKLYVHGAEKQSHRYYKQQKRLALVHEKITNKRKDFLHKESRKLVNSCDYIFIEDLNMRAMSRALRLGKSVHDMGWGMFTTFLEYKTLANGTSIVKVDGFYPSSQLCNVCGIKNPEVKNLKIREWSCPHCGTFHNRDHNAAINIKNEGLRLALNP